MIARNVSFLMLAAFIAVSELLIYNAYYKPVSSSGVGLPAISHQK
jgi:hypothetical protein